MRWNSFFFILCLSLAVVKFFFYWHGCQCFFVFLQLYIPWLSKYVLQIRIFIELLDEILYSLKCSRCCRLICKFQISQVSVSLLYPSCWGMWRCLSGWVSDKLITRVEDPSACWLLFSMNGIHSMMQACQNCRRFQHWGARLFRQKSGRESNVWILYIRCTGKNTCNWKEKAQDQIRSIPMSCDDKILKTKRKHFSFVKKQGNRFLPKGKWRRIISLSGRSTWKNIYSSFCTYLTCFLREYLTW
jgi:hypothetical protein